MKLNTATASALQTASRTCKLTPIFSLPLLRLYNTEGEAVYMVAALGVVMNTETGAQRFYGGKETAMLAKMEGEQLNFHRDDILSIDLSKDRKLVVTGQVGKWPSVHVWDALTCEKVSSF